MSKNLTRKGLAFGALVALASSLVAGTPASADANGPITLLPNGGTGTNATFNSIIGAGITLSAVLDSNLDVPKASGDEEKARYVVSNPSGATLTITLPSVTAATAGYVVFNSSGEAIHSGSTAGAATATAVTSLGAKDFNCGSGSTAAACTTTNRAGLTAGAGLPWVDVVDETDLDEFTTNATKIVFGASINDASTNAVEDTFANIKVDTTSTDAVAVKVQAFSDVVDAASGTGYALMNAFELKSAQETVNLYPSGAVSATTTITTLAAGASDFAAKVVYGSSINPYAVAAATSVVLNKDGAAAYVSATSGGANAARLTPSAAKTLTVAGYGSASSAALTNFPSGVYAAQAYFTPDAGTTWVAVGSASAVVDLTSGGNATVAGVKVSAVDTKDQIFTAGAATVRAGTKTALLSVQAQAGTSDSSANVEAANIQVRATVTATKLNTGSSATVSGATGTLAATDDEVVAYGRTDAAGKVSFTFTNTVGKADDKLTASIAVKNNSGVWVDATSETITWATAAYSSAKVKPGTYISGANPTVSIIAVDQFGEGVDSATSGSLSVYASAYLSGVESTTTYASTASTVSGKATFTFKNFAPAGGSAVLKWKLIGTKGSTATVITNGSVNVYNSLATDKIVIADSFKNDVTYKDFVTGDSADSAVAAKIANAGIATNVDITGTVLNVSNVGQPGVAVTVAIQGALLKADGVYATDKITTYANEYGNFTVGVASHLANTKGAVVTVTADGKTATTKLVSYLPKDGLTSSTLKLSWNLPAFLVKDTTYAVAASLTDVWGNPVQTAGATGSVSFLGTGAVQVNGVGTAVVKDFDKTGKAIVFVRSVSKIAGPGSLTATLSAVADAYAIDPLVNGTAGNAGVDNFGSLTAVTTDVTTTAWDETLFSKELAADVVIRDLAPKATITKAATSKVLVKNASGLTVKVVRGSKSVTKAVTSNSTTISLKGGSGTVKVYVNGVKVASK